MTKRQKECNVVLVSQQPIVQCAVYDQEIHDRWAGWDVGTTDVFLKNIKGLYPVDKRRRVKDTVTPTARRYAIKSAVKHPNILLISPGKVFPGLTQYPCALVALVFICSSPKRFFYGVHGIPRQCEQPVAISRVYVRHVKTMQLPVRLDTMMHPTTRRAQGGEYAGGQTAR